MYLPVGCDNRIPPVLYTLSYPLNFLNYVQPLPFNLRLYTSPYQPTCAGQEGRGQVVMPLGAP